MSTEASAWISADRIAAELNLADMVEPVADALRAYSRGAATSTALGLLRLAGNGEAHDGEVDVVPAQPEHLGETHARVRSGEERATAPTSVPSSRRATSPTYSAGRSSRASSPASTSAPPAPRSRSRV